METKDLPFLFFGGIDGVAPYINGCRADQHALSQHDNFWQTDFSNTVKLGLKTLRWGPNWYRVNPKPDVYDWSWVDDRMYYAEEIGLDIWYGLQHKQVPDFIEHDGNILSKNFPDALRKYGEQVARRYHNLKRMSISIEADFYSLISCRWGQWSPHRIDKFEEALGNMALAINMTADAVKNINPDIELVHTEFAPGLMLTGMVYNSMDSLALDYYPPHGETMMVWIEKWWKLFKKPMYIGETDMPGGKCDHDINHQVGWLRSTINDCRVARKNGIPMIGYCPYPTVTDNLYWGTNQVTQYECKFGDGFMGDNAGIYRFKPDAKGVLHRVPSPEMVNALQEEMRDFHAK